MSLIELVYQSKSIHFFYVFYSIIMQVFQENSWSHMWFLYAFIGCYFLSPVIRTWLNRCSVLEYRLTVFFIIIFSFIPSSNDYFNLKISSFGYVTSGVAFLYFVLGRFLYLNKDNISLFVCVIFFMYFWYGYCFILFKRKSLFKNDCPPP